MDNELLREVRSTIKKKEAEESSAEEELEGPLLESPSVDLPKTGTLTQMTEAREMPAEAGRDEIIAINGFMAGEEPKGRNFLSDDTLSRI
jgi:hypothetical protein